MSIIDFLLLLLVAGICGALGQSVAGYSHGGCLGSVDSYAKRHEGGGEVHKRQVIAGRLLVSRGNATVVFQAVKEAFDQVASFVTTFGISAISLRLLRGGMTAFAPCSVITSISASESYPLSAITYFGS